MNEFLENYECEEQINIEEWLWDIGKGEHNMKIEIGCNFGELTTLSETHGGLVFCKCNACGNYILIKAISLKNGDNKTCGCGRKNHGKSNSRLFKIWCGMKNRCYYEHDRHYKNYGGRGIKICDEWLNDFESFYNWSIENGYNDYLTIDRIDNNKDYEPSNCRWASSLLQANNLKRTIRIEYYGETHTLTEWSFLSGIKRKTLQGRFERNLPIEKIFYIGALPTHKEEIDKTNIWIPDGRKKLEDLYKALPIEERGE